MLAKFYFARSPWLLLFSLLFPSPPPSRPVAAFLYECNFLSYLSGSNGVFEFYLFPPELALSLAPRSHYQLGEFLCLG